MKKTESLLKNSDVKTVWKELHCSVCGGQKVKLPEKKTVNYLYICRKCRKKPNVKPIKGDFL